MKTLTNTEQEISQLIWGKVAMSNAKEVFFQNESLNSKKTFICLVGNTNSLGKEIDWCIALGENKNTAKQFLEQNGISVLVIIDYQTWLKTVNVFQSQESTSLFKSFGMPELPYIKQTKYVVLIEEEFKKGEKLNWHNNQTGRLKLIKICAPSKLLALIVAKRHSAALKNEQSAKIIGLASEKYINMISQIVEQIKQKEEKINVRIIETRKDKVVDSLSLYYSREYKNMSPTEIVEMLNCKDQQDVDEVKSQGTGSEGGNSPKQRELKSFYREVSPEARNSYFADLATRIKNARLLDLSRE